VVKRACCVQTCVQLQDCCPCNNHPLRAHCPAIVPHRRHAEKVKDASRRGVALTVRSHERLGPNMAMGPAQQGPGRLFEEEVVLGGELGGRDAGGVDRPRRNPVGESGDPAKANLTWTSGVVPQSLSVLARLHEWYSAVTLRRSNTRSRAPWAASWAAVGCCGW